MISRREAFAASLLGLLPEGQLLAFENDEGKDETLQKLNQLIKTLADALQHLRLTSPPIGSVQAFAGEWPPQKADGKTWHELDIGWLVCNGQKLSEAEAKLHDELRKRGKRPPAGGLLKELRAVLRADHLPDLRGRTLVAAGASPGLSARKVGDKGGSEMHVLTVNEMPAHAPTVTDPGHGHLLELGRTGKRYSGGGSALLDDDFRKGEDAKRPPPPFLAKPNTTGISLQNSGGSQAHNNMQPFMVVNYIIKFA